MATPPEKLAASLEVLQLLQNEGKIAIRARDLSKTHRERLLRLGFLQRVMKGWYIASNPDTQDGETTAWYASFWGFCAAYLDARFGQDWALGPEQSLMLHCGNWRVPGQLLVRAARAGNKPTELMHGTSIFETRSARPPKGQEALIDGLRLFSIPAALVEVGATFFRLEPTEARAALAMIQDAHDVLTILLEGGHSTVAGRLAGAFRNIGQTTIADNILKSMRAGGYDVRENDPFEGPPSLAQPLVQSPFVNRLRLMWQACRDSVVEVFPEAPATSVDIEKYLADVDEIYVTDAYHSLSIEGYQVSPELIERVRQGNWDPEANEADREHRNALAARGYYLAFQAVKDSLRKVLRGEDPARVAEIDHQEWHRELFVPSVQSGIVRAADLAGYRSGPVYIRGSTHVPPSSDAVRDLMPTFFELLSKEQHPGVRVVLGHYFFVYIHPYMDGNGRIGRFLMNVMMAAAGLPWTVIPVDKRNTYMEALEVAGRDRNIRPFATFLAGEVRDH